MVASARSADLGDPLQRGLALGIVLVACAGGLFKALGHPRPAPFELTRAAEAGNEAPRFQSRFVSRRQGVLAHAASLVEMRDGRIRAFWYSGSREGARDVEIHGAVFDPRRGEWGAEHTVVGRPAMQRALQRYLAKLGNPVAARGADGTLWLFVVTVSLGGWAGSSITAMSSRDDGETWSAPRRLVTSPFLNLSTLVKATPFLYADGTLGLPVYHEFIGKFGEVLRLDPSGSVLDKQRLTHGAHSLQPVVLVKGETDALALMRHSGSAAPRRVVVTSTTDAGEHWASESKLPLANPDAALSGVVLGDGVLLVALNDIEEGRDVLSLAVSRDGGVRWERVHDLENQRARRAVPFDRAGHRGVLAALASDTGAAAGDAAAIAASAESRSCRGERCGFEFSYPYLIQVRNGEVHLAYTWNNSFIKHVRFNRAWLDRRMENSLAHSAH
jgi:predicted neuraminidase